MRDRAFLNLAIILGLLLVAVVPAQAGTVPFSDVVVGGSFQNGGRGQDLRLRTVSQSGGTATTTTTASTTDTAPSSLISTAAAPQDGPGTVETVEQGDITGTICDCGEISIPGGGIPWWPFLGGVAGVCLIPDLCTTTKCPPGTPGCDETIIPEPATLLLFGSGLAALGAGARRRRRRQAKGVSQTAATMREV